MANKRQLRTREMSRKRKKRPQLKRVQRVREKKKQMWKKRLAALVEIFHPTLLVDYQHFRPLCLKVCSHID